MENGDQQANTGTEHRLSVTRADVLALAALLLGIAIVSAHRFYFDNWLSRHDLLAFFLPWHGFLGESLRDGVIPGWSANVLAGTPFLGDPESGWWYFPAMALFPFLKITVAMKAMILVQLLIGGTSTYSLGRVLGFGVAGALLSSFAFVFGPFLFAQTECCTVGAGVSGWIPLALVGVELGFRCRGWVHRIAMWCIAGLAISQILAVWLGQGAAIALLIIGGWVGYRGLIDPPVRRRFQDRVTLTLLSGIAVLGSGVALAAAGLLPRLAVNEESTVAGGSYANAPGARDESPIELRLALDYLLRDERASRSVAIGGIVAVLVVLAIVFGRQRYAVPFFAAMWVVVLALSLPHNIVHDVLYLIPRFEDLQIHSPTRVFWVAYILPSMLGGAGLAALLRVRDQWRNIVLVFVPIVTLYAIDAYMSGSFHAVERRVFVVAWLATFAAVTVVVAAFSPDVRVRYQVPRVVGIAFIVATFAWPNVPEMWDSVRNPHGDPGVVKMWGRDAWVGDAVETTLASDDPGGAGEYFQALQDDGEVFRYASYSGNGSVPGPNTGAPGRRLEANIIATLVNGRPFQLDVQNVSGYNPLQLLVFNQYLAAANGRIQDYHHADLFSSGAGSPLIDMLNVEYFIVDARLSPNRADVIAFSSQGPVVFRNDRIVIYRNESALPRAWMVHEVYPTGEWSLNSLANGSVNPRTTAYVEGYQPGDFPLGPVVSDTVTVTSYDHDRVEVTVQAGSDGLLVLGDIHADGWSATVDSESAEILRTNHALRGVPVTAGEHTIVFTYEAPHLRAGMAISLATGLGMLSVWGYAAWQYRRPA